MTKQILTEHWVSPATPVKKIGKETKDATAKGRKIQGEKGIGRFAILKLGKTVSIVSRPEGLQSRIHARAGSLAVRRRLPQGKQQRKVLFLKDIEIKFSSTPKPKVIREGRDCSGCANG